MKKKNSNKVLLGIFVSVALVSLISVIYLIGKKREMFSNTFHINGIFRDIRGLQVGSNIRFSGINVGVIDNIEIISDTTVKVGMSLESTVKKFIKKNARALIASDGLMGGKIISILPGTSDTLGIQNNDLVATEIPVSIDDILQNLKVSTSNAAAITQDFAAIMGNIRSGNGTVGKLFMDNGLAKNIDQTMVNIKQGAGGFKSNMDAASHNFLLRGFFKKKNKKNKKPTSK